MLALPTTKRGEMNNLDWEKIYEEILKDIVTIVEKPSRFPDEKIDQIIEILVSNDFMEKPSIYS
jgi:hypothetical protein